MTNATAPLTSEAVLDMDVTELADLVSEAYEGLAYVPTEGERGALAWIGDRYTVVSVLVDSIDDDTGVMMINPEAVCIALKSEGVDRVPCLSEDTALALLAWLCAGLSYNPDNEAILWCGNSVRKYSDVGSYPVYYVTKDGSALSAEAVLDTYSECCDPDSDSYVTGHDINWENEELYCGETGEQIECAYPSDKPTYTVCDSCLPAIINGDWTHLDASCCCNTAENDGHSEDCVAEEEYATVTAWLELVGWLTHAGEADEPGYFDCECCNATQCGGGHIMEGQL